MSVVNAVSLPSGDHDAAGNAAREVEIINRMGRAFGLGADVIVFGR